MVAQQVIHTKILSQCPNGNLNAPLFLHVCVCVCVRVRVRVRVRVYIAPHSFATKSMSCYGKHRNQYNAMGQRFSTGGLRSTGGGGADSSQGVREMARENHRLKLPGKIKQN